MAPSDVISLTQKHEDVCMKRLLLLTVLLITPAFAGDLGLHDQGTYEKYCQREFKADRRSLILGMGKNAKLTFTPELMKVETDEGVKNRLIKKGLIVVYFFATFSIYYFHSLYIN